jgi:hypothetical protein
MGLVGHLQGLNQQVRRGSVEVLVEVGFVCFFCRGWVQQKGL